MCRTHGSVVSYVGIRERTGLCQLPNTETHITNHKLHKSQITQITNYTNYINHTTLAPTTR